MNKAVFFDRDGVINIDKGYVSKIPDFEFYKGIFEIMRYFLEKGYLLIVVTNQSGIGRGYFSVDDFRKVNRYMLDCLRRENIKISCVYYCPSSNDNDFYRKPNPGMILKAKDRHHIDLKKSVLIGDKKQDIIAGKRAGVGCNILLKQFTVPNFRVSKLTDIVRLVNNENNM